MASKYSQTGSEIVDNENVVEIVQDMADNRKIKLSNPIALLGENADTSAIIAKINELITDHNNS